MAEEKNAPTSSEEQKTPIAEAKSEGLEAKSASGRDEKPSEKSTETQATATTKTTPAGEKPARAKAVATDKTAAAPAQPVSDEAKAAVATKLNKNDAKAQPDDEGRRGFLQLIGGAWLAFSAAVSAGTVSMLRFMFPNVLFEPPTSFKVGYPDEFIVGQVDIRFKEKYGIWIVRSQEGFYALSTICTHLGCTPNWLSAENKFKCPCHGSGFYKTGINFEGPAPRPLERYRVMLADDGQIMIDKSRKFQQEKGEWNDPESFLSYGVS